MLSSIAQESIPSRVLEDIAARCRDEMAPVKIYGKSDHAALAAEGLWLFAQRTGLDQEGETLNTVLIDFMANVLHLCRHTGLISDEVNCFDGIMQLATMHVEMDQEPDDE
jgi:hypothetical protein